MRSPEQEIAARDKRRHLLARMAGNVAAGIVPKGIGRMDSDERRIVAADAVGIARAILEELER